jgi:hypothetical protein
MNIEQATIFVILRFMKQLFIQSQLMCSVANRPKFLPQNTKVAGKNMSGRRKLRPILHQN